MAIYQMLFFKSSPNSHEASGYIWGHNFWTNYDLDPLSTSKWPSEPPFCERWRYIWQKNGQKRSYNSYLRVTFISDHSLARQLNQILFFVTRRFWKINSSKEAYNFCLHLWMLLSNFCYKIFLIHCAPYGTEAMVFCYQNCSDLL